MMKNLRILCLIVLCVALTAVTGYTKDVGKTTAKQYRHMSSFKNVKPETGTSVNVPMVSAQASTTWLGIYSFDSGPGCVDEGWTHLDRTLQYADHWHVDDFAGLSGGSYGNLYPIQGTKSAWCGARPDAGSLILCGYASLPGYGNNWDQNFCSACYTVAGNVTMNFMVAWDSEPGYDGTVIQYDYCDDNWTDVASSANSGNGGVYDNFSPLVFDTVVVDTNMHAGTLRIGSILPVTVDGLTRTARGIQTVRLFSTASGCRTAPVS